MNTKVLSIEALKEIISQFSLSKTDKITKITKGSVVNSLFYGIAKVSQKALKDIAIVESHLFPEYAYGIYLDNIVDRLGIPSRLPASGSSTYIRIVASEGTVYLPNINRFVNSAGLYFDLTDSVTVPAIGYVYAKVNSSEVGLKSNVLSNTITSVTPAPSGHLYVTNDYQSEGGRDSESDEELRIRIKNSLNILSTGTLSYLTQVCIKINPKVLRLIKGGFDNSGKIKICVVSCDGSDFTNQELSDLILGVSDYLCLSDVKIFAGQGQGVIFYNPTWKPIDVEFRLDVLPGTDLDLLRSNIQNKFSKIVDYRYWKYGDRIEWEDLFFAVKGINEVKYVPDNYFYPNYDIPVLPEELPRFRSFIMRDMNGFIINTNGEILNPVFYPNEFIVSIQGLL